MVDIYIYIYICVYIYIYTYSYIHIYIYTTPPQPWTLVLLLLRIRYHILFIYISPGPCFSGSNARVCLGLCSEARAPGGITGSSKSKTSRAMAQRRHAGDAPTAGWLTYQETQKTQKCHTPPPQKKRRQKTVSTRARQIDRFWSL